MNHMRLDRNISKYQYMIAYIGQGCTTSKGWLT